MLDPAFDYPHPQAPPIDPFFNNLTPSNQRLVRELIAKLQPLDTPQISDNFHPQDYVNEWLSHLLAENKSPGSIRLYSNHLRMLLAQFPHPITSQLEAHLASCRARGNSVAFINTKIAAFRSFYSFCYEKGYISSDPTSRLHSLKIPVRERITPPSADIHALLSLNLRPRDRALLYLLVDCGLRLGEVRSIKLIHIGQCEVTVIGKGDKQRTVPLSTHTMSAINALRSELRPDDIYLFPGRFPGTCWTWRGIQDRLTSLCLEAGIPRITPHQIRHYFATSMLNEHANLKVVSQILGHSTPAVTADVYWHVDAGMKQREHSLHSPLKHLVKESD